MDISDQKRRRALERIFFHDILNTAGSLVNITELLSKREPPDENHFVQLARMASKQLMEEIKAQRQLMQAESGELKVKPTKVDSQDCLNQAIGLFKEFNELHGLEIVLSPDSQGLVHCSDRILLLRVLGNLIKNALEACKKGQTVTVGCRPEGADGVAYWVNNRSYMPQDIQLQIFQRSFSTKGEGRGLGTYSIRLLTEKFLKGKVSFQSSPNDGTSFVVSYPLRPF